MFFLQTSAYAPTAQKVSQWSALTSLSSALSDATVRWELPYPEPEAENESGIDRNRPCDTDALTRRKMQMVFQDPFGSLSPRRKVVDIIAEPMDSFGLSGCPYVPPRFRYRRHLRHSNAMPASATDVAKVLNRHFEFLASFLRPLLKENITGRPFDAGAKETTIRFLLFMRPENRHSSLSPANEAVGRRWQFRPLGTS